MSNTTISSASPNLPATSDQAFEVKEKLAALESALVSEYPLIPSLLREILTKLKNDPDNVTVLTADECAVLVRGLSHQTKTEISVKAAKAVSKTSRKAASKITLDDL